MKISSVLSTITNLALMGFDFIGTPSFLDSFFASASSSPIITFISMPRLFNFANVSLNIFCFFSSSNEEEVRCIVLVAPPIMDFICRYRFERPLIEVESSWFLIGSIPVLWSSLSSLYSCVSFSVDSVFIFSSACEAVLFFSFSITISGFTAIYFTGLPSFCITNPRFSRDSNTSYVLERGTLESSAISPADDIPLDSKASHTFVS